MRRGKEKPEPQEPPPGEVHSASTAPEETQG
jgi:hypothetical protein